MFAEYRRHHEEQRARSEASNRQLLEQAVRDTLYANQQRALAEDKLRQITQPQP